MCHIRAEISSDLNLAKISKAFNLIALNSTRMKYFGTALQCFAIIMYGVK